MTFKPPSKSDQLRAMREANISRGSVESRHTAPTQPGTSVSGYSEKNRSGKTESAVARGPRESKSRAKANNGKTGMAVGLPHVRQNNRRMGLRVGAADAVQPATSEIMDVTGGESAASNSKRGRGRPKIEGKRPWEKAGVSRRTWYRRQKEKAKP